MLQYTVRSWEFHPDRPGDQDARTEWLTDVARLLYLKLTNRYVSKVAQDPRVILTFGMVFEGTQEDILHWAEWEFDFWAKMAAKSVKGVSKLAFVVDITTPGGYKLWNPPGRLISPSNNAWLQDSVIHMTNLPSAQFRDLLTHLGVL